MLFWSSLSFSWATFRYCQSKNVVIAKSNFSTWFNKRNLE